MSIKVSDTNELANDTGSDTATDSHAKRLTLTRETLQVLRVRSTLRTGLIDAGHGLTVFDIREDQAAALASF